MEAVAKLKNIRMSPRKLRLVADVVRGKPVQRAIDDLCFSTNTMAVQVVKLIRSAVNNASQNRGVNVDKLVVKKIYVDQGPTFKRIMTRARGSADQLLKRSAHLTVIVDEAEAQEKKAAKGSKKKASSAQKGDK